MVDAVPDSKAFKQPLLSALGSQIRSLQGLALEIEQAEIPDMVSINDLAQVIRQRRESLGLSRSQAAALTGVSATTWSALERSTGNPRLETLREAARTLNLRLWVDAA